MQVFLEGRVIRLDHRHAELACDLLADPMGDERSVDVHGVDTSAERKPGSARGTRMHHAVFRIEDEVAGRKV
jgi:hypothetical protein